ncbi:MAG: hypothetical protein COW01_01700 [Bdellovibrionales bacterium CG12_big_fil_rev_8_21_14_0_65_38_15]|nr:MAG: hypothetical protein COW01_01700 [Bdellovibrionales bacterium CG12_big_fil_rev_8_21_14_0_65_38_15]PIR31379.1 MAG: hypothetical protein COV38_00790 [Bdellovibrionales bacterium CG11_big_fil_rev_8_21_14_0_20_38_13]
MDGLDLLFKVNLIFIDDQKDQISNEGLRSLFKLLVHANQNAFRINNSFAKYEEKKISLNQLKTEFTQALTNLSNAGIDSIPLHKSSVIEIEQTIKEVSSKFNQLSLNDNQIKLIKIIKKMFIGNDSNLLSCDELRTLLSKMNQLSSILFDVLYIDEYKLNTKTEHYSFFQERIDLFFKSLNLEQKGIILSHKDIAFLTTYLNLDIEQDIVEKIAKSAKDNLFSEEDSHEGFNAKDLNLLKTYSHAYLKSFLTWEAIEYETASKMTSPKSFYETTLTKWAQDITELVDTTTLPEELKISLFLNDLKNLLNIDKKNIQLLDSIMLLKPLLVGGKPSRVTPLEISRLLPKLKDLALIAFDVKIFAREDQTRAKWLDFALKTIQTVEKNIHKGDDYEVAFMTAGLENFKVFFDDSHRSIIDGIIGGFPAIKKRLFGGHEEVVLFKEFRQIFSEAKDTIETLFLTDITSDLYQKELKSAQLIKNLPYKHHPLYNNFSEQRISRFKSDFKYVLAKFHYYLNSDNLQYYQTDIIRSKEGVLTNVLLRHLAKIFLKAYGHEEDGHYMLSIEEIDFMMKQFKPMLEPMGLWTKKIETFARNMLLLSDLFQSRSNGNASMDVDEAVEYISMVMVSVEIQTNLMKTYPQFCSNTGTDDEPSFETSCYRPKFFDLIFNNLKLGKYLPKLKNYIDTAPKEESLKFLRAVEGFARDFDDEAIPMAKRDIVLLVGALLNIESTFVRFDQIDENNILDSNELDRAFYVYRKGIVSVAELSEDQEQYSKSIFLYMVQKMEMPSKTSLFIFHNNPMRGTVDAKRLNIGTLLYYLVQE